MGREGSVEGADAPMHDDDGMRRATPATRPSPRQGTRTAARRAACLLGVAALLAAAPAHAADGVGWWPPLPGPAASSPMAGWAVSKDGPMFMPRAVREILYGPAGSMDQGEKLRTILRKIWEHLAQRVDDMGELEAKSGLYEQEIAALRRRGVHGSKVVRRLHDDLAGLEQGATRKRQELARKFAEVLQAERRLARAFPQMRGDVRTFYRSLREARERTEDHGDRLLRRVRRSQARLVQAENAADPDALFAGAGSRDHGRGHSTATLAEELAALSGPDYAPGGGPTPDDAADDRLYGNPAAMPEPEAVPMPRKVPTGDAGPTPGEDWLYTRGGRRRSAGELVKARIARLRAERGETMARADDGVSDALAPLPGTAGIGGVGGGMTEPLPGSASVLPTRRPPPTPRDAAAPDDLYRGAGNPPAPVHGGRPRPPPTRPLSPPDAEGLLEDFLDDPNVYDQHLSKRPGAGKAKRPTYLAARPDLERTRLPPAPPPLPGPPPEVRGKAAEARLGSFAAQLELELAEAARSEGLDATRSFSGRRLPAPDPREGSPRSVQAILAELERLER